ncbi:hypothetical protein Y032_0618g716 [Ancylostoma ceylanicum]|uniref:Uncharacterized protein n=1 Tax=Ancylostoma ceylanicum TaxID=53326 RepID=A0A016WL75_9BILA|nr:hypothetical protein Y032_0618g716 [Ancylostoma ceylanicum]
MYDRVCSTPKCVVCPEGRAGDCMISGVIYMICCKSCAASSMIEEQAYNFVCMVLERFGRMVCLSNRPFQALKKAICRNVGQNKLIINSVHSLQK